MLCRPPARAAAVLSQQPQGCCRRCATVRWSSQLLRRPRPPSTTTSTTTLLPGGWSPPPLQPAVVFLESRRGAARRPARSPTVRRAERQQQQQQAVRPPLTATTTARPRSSGDPSTDGTAAMDAEQALQPALDLAIGALGLFAFATRDECVAALAASRRVLQERATASDAVLEKENLFPYKIHSLAVLLLFGGSGLPGTDAGSGSRRAQCFSLAMALLHLAATAGMAPVSPASPAPQPGGYLPATLTILNMFGVDAAVDGAASAAATGRPDSNRSSVSAKMRQSRMYQTAERQFLAYMAASQKDPASAPTTPFDAAMRANAFTLAGVLAEAAGNPARALRWYRAAQAAGAGEGGDPAADGDVRPRAPRWDWERRCLEALGRLQAPGGDGEQALRTAALALGSGEACMRLATMYETGADETKQAEIDTLLHQAAVGDAPGAMEALAAREERRAAAAAGETVVAEEHRLLAAEWRQMAAVSAAVEVAA